MDKTSFIQRFVLVMILFVILFYSYTGELVAYNEGLGWDGEYFYKIVQNFDKMILSHGIERYYMTRFFPFAVLHYALSFFGIPINIPNAILAARIMNFILMVVLVFYFFKLSSLLKWDAKTELIAFSFTFFNIQVLKMIGYYPIGSCSLSLVLSYAAAYYFFKGNILAQVVVGLLAMITWPILSVVVFLLVLIPRDKVNDTDNSRFNLAFSSIVRLFFMFFSPAVFIYIMIRTYFANPGVDVYFLLYKLKGTPNIGITFVSIASLPLFYYYATSVLKLDWAKIFQSVFRKKSISLLFLGFFVFISIYMGLTNLGGISKMSLSLQIAALGEYPTSDILVFLETHFLYKGLFFLFIIILWNKIVNVIKVEYGIGYFFVIMFALILFLDIETRKLLAFYPFMLVPLMAVLQKMNIKWVASIFIALFSLFFSCFWFNFNTPEIAEAFNQDVHTYYTFPAQRYYMFLGPWQCHEVYWITLYFEVLLGIIIVNLYRKGLLTNKS